MSSNKLLSANTQLTPIKTRDFFAIHRVVTWSGATAGKTVLVSYFIAPWRMHSSMQAQERRIRDSALYSLFAGPEGVFTS